MHFPSCNVTRFLCFQLVMGNSSGCVMSFISELIFSWTFYYGPVLVALASCLSQYCVYVRNMFILALLLLNASTSFLEFETLNLILKKIFVIEMRKLSPRVAFVLDLVHCLKMHYLHKAFLPLSIDQWGQDRICPWILFFGGGILYLGNSGEEHTDVLWTTWGNHGTGDSVTEIAAYRLSCRLEPFSALNSWMQID